MNRYFLLAGTLAVLSSMAIVPGAAASVDGPGDFGFAPYVHYWPTYNVCGGEPHCDVAYGFSAVWIGDMTGDGRDDVVTAPDENEIWIVPQRTDGTLLLDAPRKFAYGDNVYTHQKHFVLGDFNEDGAKDLVGNYSGYGLGMNVLLSDGAGGHVLHELHDLPAPDGFHTDWRHPAAEDVDGDGHLDVLLFLGHWDANAPQPPAGVVFVAIRYGDGDGNFPRMALVQLAEHQAMRTELADFNGDGRRDIALQVVVGFPGESLLAISYHDGRSGYLPAVVTELPFDDTAVFAELDGDEQAEMALGWGSSLLAVSVPDPSSTSVATLAPTENIFPYVMLATDLNRDGRQDIYSTQFKCPNFCTWTYIAPYLNLADGWLPIPTPLTEDPHIPQNVTYHPRSFASGDVNGDGCTDVVTAHNQDGLAILHGTRCVTPARRPRSDFDGDGIGDIVWRHAQSGRNVLWLSGQPADLRRLTGVMNLAWEIVATGDFDGDGIGDLFWRNRETGANALWPRGAPGGPRVRAVRDTSWEVVGTGDFDGDGRDDLFWRHALNGANDVWSGAEPRSFPVVDVPNPLWRVAAIGDFNGDRIDDVFWRNAQNGRLAIWWSASHVGQSSAGRVSDGAWQIGGAGDLDGDRREDLLWRHVGSGNNVVWSGADSRARLPMTAVTNSLWSIATVADLTGDGIADVLWRHRDNGKIVVWRNGDRRDQRAAARVADLSWQIVPSD